MQLKSSLHSQNDRVMSGQNTGKFSVMSASIAPGDTHTPNTSTMAKLQYKWNAADCLHKTMQSNCWA